MTRQWLDDVKEWTRLSWSEMWREPKDCVAWRKRVSCVASNELSSQWDSTRHSKPSQNESFMQIIQAKNDRYTYAGPENDRFRSIEYLLYLHLRARLLPACLSSSKLIPPFVVQRRKVRRWFCLSL